MIHASQVDHRIGFPLAPLPTSNHKKATNHDNVSRDHNITVVNNNQQSKLMTFWQQTHPDETRILHSGKTRNNMQKVLVSKPHCKAVLNMRNSMFLDKTDKLSSQS